MNDEKNSPADKIVGSSDVLERKIVLREERRGDTWYITGENITGLWLWSKDREKLWAMIPATIDALLRANGKLT